MCIPKETKYILLLLGFHSALTEDVLLNIFLKIHSRPSAACIVKELCLGGCYWVKLCGVDAAQHIRLRPGLNELTCRV